MTRISKRIIVLLFGAMLVALMGVGCNTAHGFGKDVEKAGQEIQKGTQ
jgi:predicted small secreted protein